MKFSMPAGAKDALGAETNITPSKTTVTLKGEQLSIVPPLVVNPISSKSCSTDDSQRTPRILGVEMRCISPHQVVHWPH